MIYVADEKWFPTNDNPYSLDGAYGSNWSSFIYDESIGFYSNIYPNTRVYTLRVSSKIDTNYERLFDFLNYEISYGRNVIIKFPKDINADRVLSLFKESDKKVVFRNTDSPYMVHSTTTENWKSIQKTGALLSPNMLRKSGQVIHEIGLRPMLEPDDYSDYIMLDALEGCGELVVNSRQLGYVCTDPDRPYMPGVRLYFDVRKMMQDRMVVRDGLHILKVKHRLPLERYLIAAITTQVLDTKKVWTPTTFTNAANQFFLSNCRK